MLFFESIFRVMFVLVFLYLVRIILLYVFFLSFLIIQMQLYYLLFGVLVELGELQEGQLFVGFGIGFQEGGVLGDGYQLIENYRYCLFLVCFKIGVVKLKNGQ